MEQYTIYCTEEQTRKALELGASIKLLLDDFTDNYEDCEVCAIPPQEDELGIMCNYAVIPTAEQMIGWLEEQGLAIDIIRDNTCYKSSVWRNDSPDDGWDFYKENEVKKFSRKEATLSAINAALAYLKKEE